MLNPKFSLAASIAKAIPNRPDADSKRRAIMAWCWAVKKAIQG